MIGILMAVVVVVGIVAAADLLLSFAVIRRLIALESGGLALGAAAGLSPAVGHRVGEFRMKLVTGGEFSQADLADARAMVTFLMPSCEPCEEAFAELRALPIPLATPLYVLVMGIEQDSDLSALIADLPAGAHVGTVLLGDAATDAFGVTGFPTALITDDGLVRAVGLRVSQLDLVSQ